MFGLYRRCIQKYPEFVDPLKKIPKKLVLCFEGTSHKGVGKLEEMTGYCNTTGIFQLQRTHLEIKTK